MNAQVVPYQGPVPPKSPTPSAKPPVAPADASSVPALEAQFNALYGELASAPPQRYRNADNKLQGQMQAYEALRAELDRLVPPVPRAARPRPSRSSSG